MRQPRKPIRPPTGFAPIEGSDATEFWVIRHAESEWNASGRYQGQVDVLLSALGQQQSQYLATRFAHFSFDAVYSSDLLRARHTAQAVLNRLNTDMVLHIEPRLREIDVGDLCGKLHHEIELEFPDYVQAVRQDPWTTPRPNGESVQDLYKRVEEAFAELHTRHKGQRVLVFTHGGVVRVALSLALGLPLHSIWSRLSIENTAVTRLRLSEQGGRLISFNDSAHLEEDVDWQDDAT